MTGAIDATTQGFLAAFDAIKRFLANKPRVLAHLQPLAAPVNDAPDKLAALKQELRRKEAEAGFGAPKVPHRARRVGLQRRVPGGAALAGFGLVAAQQAPRRVR